MKDFIFHTPTKVVFGREAEAKLGGNCFDRKPGIIKCLDFISIGTVDASIFFHGSNSFQILTMV